MHDIRFFCKAYYNKPWGEAYSKTEAKKGLTLLEILKIGTEYFFRHFPTDNGIFETNCRLILKSRWKIIHWFEINETNYRQDENFE